MLGNALRLLATCAVGVAGAHAQNRVIVADHAADSVLVVDADTQSTVTVLPITAPRDVAVTADGHLALVTGPGTLHYLDLSVDPPVHIGSAPITLFDPFDVAVPSGCGGFIALTGQFAVSDVHVGCLYPLAGALASQALAPFPAHACTQVPDGNLVLATSLNTSHVFTFPLSPTGELGASLQSLPTSGEPYDLDVSPDGRRVLVVQDPPAFGGEDLLVYALAGDVLSFVNGMTLGGLASSVRYAPDGARAYVLRRSAVLGSIDVLDIDANGDPTFQTAFTVPEPTFGVRSGIDNLAVSPDSSRLFAATHNVLTVIDTSSLTVLGSLPLTLAGGVAAYGPIPLIAGSPRLTLEADSCQADQDPVLPGAQLEIALWMRDLPADATGYQAFLTFDVGQLMFEGLASSYSATPFDGHFQTLAAAEVAPGSLQLDGHASALAPDDQDALLATLVFTALAECTPLAVQFDLAASFESEVCIAAPVLGTTLVDSPAVISDATPPVITPPADVVLAADAGVGDGCQSAVLEYSDPLVTDACSRATILCSPPTGTAFPAGATTTVTCTATDGCGNQSQTSFDVTVTSTNLVDVDVQFVGSGAATRCVRFTVDDCSAVEVQLALDANGRFIGSIEVPCGAWTTLCAKDPQHTMSSTVSISLSGDSTRYVADAQLVLVGGDTDDDGDVDINDVTLLISQFGQTVPVLAPCPWDGTRDADFDNDGAIGTPDYSFLTANWLSMTSCICAPSSSPPPPKPATRIASASSADAARADLNRDGWVDWRDVEIFERQSGLSGELSRAIRSTLVPRTR